MKEFVRGPIWVDEAARELWLGRQQSISAAWQKVELESVAAGVRDACLVFCDAEGLTLHQAWAAEHGLHLTVVQAVAVKDLTTPPFRIALHRIASPSKWLEAWKHSDDIAIGELLGFPNCCVQFFAPLWAAGIRDSTWAQSREGAFPDGPISSNLLLRWLGIRLVPHLPCSYTCEQTERFARALYPVWGKLGHMQELRWACELLAQPAEYSSLHGIGKVTVLAAERPIYKFEFDTDYRHVHSGFARAKSHVPTFEVIAKAQAAAAVAPEPERKLPEPVSWLDNGFAGPELMNASHAVVSMAFGRLSGDIVDLGCGDGSLLDRLRYGRSLSSVTGIEANAERVKRGKLRFPAVEFEVGKIEDAKLSGRFDVAMLMPGRLLEMSEEQATALRTQLRDVPKVLVYAYGDWLKDRSLEALCVQAQLPQPARIVRGFGVEAQAGVISWTA